MASSASRRSEIA
ncbi:hypothetical protein YPPY09_3408, partial [Yersinia pestis PY-09]